MNKHQLFVIKCWFVYFSDDLEVFLSFLCKNRLVIKRFNCFVKQLFEYKGFVLILLWHILT